MKVFEYRTSIDAEGALCAEERHPLDPGEEWTPEHLLLGALSRCTLSSLRHHAQQAGLVALAERDCFIGASLTVKVEYEWRLNGALLHAG